MIPVAKPWITNRELENVSDAVKSSWISPNGEYVSEFESKFSDFVGTEHSFAVTTGTAALHLSLVAAEIGSGDEVVVPDLTWVACANVVRYVGATPVFADVDLDTFTINPHSFKKCITEDTAAVMPVHLYGQPCKMGEILTIAGDFDLFVIEDAAEAHGATYNEKSVGSLGDVGCFSFYGNKILTTGQGGMITTDDDEVAERIRLLRRDGMSTERKYFHPVVGYNYRLTNVQAAIGVAQVERADEILGEKLRVAESYRDQLSDTDVQFQTGVAGASSAHWMNAPVFKNQTQRERVERALMEEDIQSRPFFVPLHEQPPYQAGNTDCPNATALSQRGLNLPSGPQLTDGKIETVCSTITKAL